MPKLNSLLFIIVAALLLGKTISSICVNDPDTESKEVAVASTAIESPQKPSPVVTAPAVKQETRVSPTQTVPTVNRTSFVTNQYKLGPGTRVLLIGDSLGGGLKSPLGSAIQKTGASFNAIVQDGMTIADFASSKGRMTSAFNNALETMRPTIVLVSLGTNDDYNRNSMRSVIVSTGILKRKFQSVGATAYWIGPPTLGTYCYKDKAGRDICHDPTGHVTPFLQQFLTSNFFDSRPIQMARWDGLHPTPKEFAQTWTPAIMNWMTRTA